MTEFGIIEDTLSNGLFGCSLTWILEVLPYLKKNNIYPIWHIEASCYGPLFPTILIPKYTNVSSPLKSSIRELKKTIGYNYGEHEFQKAHDLFYDYFNVAEHILTEVELIYKTFGTYTLGLHYRGTDKGSEAVFMSKDDYIKQVSAFLKLSNNKITTIFIVSDEEGFIQKTKDAFQTDYQLIFTNVKRSSTQDPLHLGNTDTRLAKEAMIDSLLLSKCNVVVKTSSCLSDWVKIWNPSIEVYNVNKFYHSWFPQAMIPVRSFLAAIE